MSNVRSSKNRISNVCNARCPPLKARAGARRGRPPKPVEELTQGYRDKKESKAHIVQAVAEHGEEEGKRLHR